MKTINEYMTRQESEDGATIAWALNSQQDFSIEKVETSNINGTIKGYYKGNYYALGWNKTDVNLYSCYVFVAAEWPEGEYGQEVSFKTDSLADVFKGLRERIEKLL